MAERIAAFDLDGTLLKGLNLFDRSIWARGRGYESPEQGNALIAPVDWLEQEVLEELERNYGSTSAEYLEQAIRYYLRNNRGQRGHQELTQLTVEGGHWPEASEFHSFTRRFARALQLGGAAYHLHCITYSPEFLAKELVVKQGIPTPEGPLRFDSATGSTYEVDQHGNLNGRAYTPGNKAASLRTTFGADIVPAYALGDTLADHSMLDLAEVGIATNPDGPLAEIARRDGLVVVQENSDRVSVSVPGKRRREVGASELLELRHDEVIQLVH